MKWGWDSPESFDFVRCGVIFASDSSFQLGCVSSACIIVHVKGTPPRPNVLLCDFSRVIGARRPGEGGAGQWPHWPASKGAAGLGHPGTRHRSHS